MSRFEMKTEGFLPGLLICLVLAGCGREWTPEQAGPCVYDRDCFESLRCVNGRCIRLDFGYPDGGTELLGFGERCEYNEECESGFCLPHPEGAFCTRPCQDGCPVGWACRQVPDPRGGSGRLGLCAVDIRRLCRPCEDDRDCHPAGSDLCMQLDDGRYCLADCWYQTCPTGYECVATGAGPDAPRQCRPLAGVCSCTEQSAGMVRSCERSNDLGTCTGYELCAPPDGWSDCSARMPAPEECNGIDDECDGFVDEDLEGASCSSQNVYGTCHGTEECRGLEGWVCAAPTPAPEACDGVDNDCDDQTDEDFRDEQGRYLNDAHCGACGNDCTVMVPHATATTCRLVDGVPRCRATACEQGYFLYQGGSACLLLPANLCQDCSSHEDCMVPGSLCIENGSESYCGRDCSDDSPYGPGCPDGYQCTPYAGSMQCQPQSDTCLCTADTLGTVRSCLVDTCTGYQSCARDGDTIRWTACNIEDFNVEICDGLDNNCNGQVDEGFLNPQTGRYESDEHCGFCNNDCSRYWSEPIDHTTGICDLDAPGMPSCAMGPCSVENEGGVEYEWVDVNGEPDDGCECRRVLGNTDQDPPDLIGLPAPGLDYIEENCDGVDGVADDALFVRADADPGGDGSIQRPLTRVQDAIDAFAQSGKSIILVAEGTYDEQVMLLPGVQIHGGYAADFLARDVARYTSVIDGALAAEDIDTTTLVSGLVIRGSDAQASAESVAVRLLDCDASLTLRSLRIVGGSGGDGTSGQSGEAGYGRQESPALDGGYGTNGRRRTGVCIQGFQNPGGAGGFNQQCPAADGNAGGTTSCPVFDWDHDPVHGLQAPYASAAGGNGLGGYDWSFDQLSGPSCSHATESGYPSEIQLNVGADGDDGIDGPNGQGGGGGSLRYGQIVDGGWSNEGGTGRRGTAGESGGSGGGGGGGGGTAYYNRGIGYNDCDMHEVGPAGGGGGAGGCGGGAGLGGQAGGASIAVLVSWRGASPVSSVPVLIHNLIQRGVGGGGGDGGDGGMGGLGGLGGFGGLPPDWISSLGGKGGDGGNGGPGGGGGGGSGGPSFGILGFNLGPVDYASDNGFVFDDDVSTGGPGGTGGISVGPGATGAPGAAGAHQNVLLVQRCDAGSTCPDGFTCQGEACMPAN